MTTTATNARFDDDACPHGIGDLGALQRDPPDDLTSGNKRVDDFSSLTVPDLHVGSGYAGGLNSEPAPLFPIGHRHLGE